MTQIFLESGRVNKIIENTPTYQLIEVLVNKEARNARLYKRLCLEVLPGDKVLVNQTARKLNLGSGGEDFVVTNLSKPECKKSGNGHIMKLRYTPHQFALPSIEEFESYKKAEANFSTLSPMKVAVGELHSMVAPIAYSIKHTCPDLKLIYIMTDGAALPLELSYTVMKLKKEKIIDSTITIGNAFGGDYEAVNIYSALIVSKEILKGDIVIVTMGPGIVGTATAMGFSGIEQVECLEGINRLGGRGLLIPRISFSEKRKRHYGLSHHTLRILKLLNNPIDLPLPILNVKEKDNHLIKQLKHINPEKNYYKHRKVWFQTNGAINFFKKTEHKFSTMGKGLDEEPDFFKALYAVSKFILKC